MRKVLNNRILLFIVAILLLANITMLVYFLRMRDQEGRSNSHTQRQKSPITVFLEQKIGFDKQQMAKFENVRQVHRRKMKPLFEDIRLAKIQFYSLLNKPAVNDTTLDHAASLIGQKQKLVDLQTFKNFKEIRFLCTPAQQPRYDSLIAGEIGKMWFPSRRDRR